MRTEAGTRIRKMKALPQVVMVPAQEKIIFQKILSYFDDILFSYIERVLKDNRVENEAEGIISALKVGKIIYSGGVFHAKTKFSNRLAGELERLGARFSKTAKGYKLAPDKLPVQVKQALAEVKIHNEEKISKIEKYLDELEGQKPWIYDQVNFDEEVEKIGKNLDNQFRRSMKTINIVPPDLTSYQLAEIAKNYTYNLNYYIKKWTEQEIITLRRDIGELVIGGYRAESLENFIEKRKGIATRKAKFLARQETKLLVAEYRKNRFKQEGITQYRWSTILDGRERELHKQLNGKIFSWSEPPIIDANTGERGNPGEAYNCRCSAIPVISDDWWEKSRK